MGAYEVDSRRDVFSSGDDDRFFHAADVGQQRSLPHPTRNWIEQTQDRGNRRAQHDDPAVSQLRRRPRQETGEDSVFRSGPPSPGAWVDTNQGSPGIPGGECLGERPADQTETHDPDGIVDVRDSPHA
jgi:hypothetical protein